MAGILHDAQAVLVRSNDISVSESRRVELDKQVTGLEADLRRVAGEHEALQQKDAALVARSELLERQAQDGERKAAAVAQTLEKAESDLRTARAELATVQGKISAAEAQSKTLQKRR